MSGNSIQVRDLTKQFGSFTAVDHLNLTIEEGRITGFLGPNGAGKTTTIGMLTTLLRPTSGSVTVAGYDIQKEGVKVREVIGVVPQSFALFPELTAEENLTYIGKLYGMSKAAIKERSEELLRIVSLYDHRDRIAGVFSGGMKQRLSLAASIMSRPKIIFMDEPTNGLDPQSRIAMRDITKQLNAQGMTVVYTTHDMDEAEKICDRIIIMDKGRIIADGTSKQLKAKIRSKPLIEIKVEHPTTQTVADLRKLPMILSAEQKGNLIYVQTKDTKGMVHTLSDFFHRRKQVVHELYLKEPTLEEVFITLTKHDLRDD